MQNSKGAGNKYMVFRLIRNRGQKSATPIRRNTLYQGCPGPARDRKMSGPVQPCPVCLKPKQLDQQ